MVKIFERLITLRERNINMEHDIKSDRLIIPVYINEKIVLDMLAIIEDGFSMVSQINYTEHTEI